MAQSVPHELFNLQEKKLPESDCLGWRRRCHVAIQTELFSWRCKETIGDHLHARLVKFSGGLVH